MNRLTSKVCILGEFAVGKTSTIERFVNNQFSDKYMTTIGVKIDTKEIRVNEIDLKLIIWDVAGTDRFTEVDFAYLRGAAGYLLVADGTRSRTIDTAQNFREQIEERVGDLPSVFLLNKADLKNTWETSADDIEKLRESGYDLFLTSAKTGDEVENAFSRLAELVVSREFAPET